MATKNTQTFVKPSFKVCVLNYSGNVGKSTVSTHLLKPNMSDDTEYYGVESFNKGAEVEGVVLKGREYLKLQEIVMFRNSMIVDVGSSNVDSFLKEARGIEGSLNDFDYFLIPIVPEAKQIDDTLNTIGELIDAFKIPPEKIKVVFNKVESLDTLLYDFEKPLGVCQYLNIPVCTDAVIMKTHFFKMLEEKGTTLADLDEYSQEQLEQIIAEYRKNPPADNDFDERRKQARFGHLLTAKRAYVSVKRNCDKAFQELFKEEIKNCNS